MSATTMNATSLFVDVPDEDGCETGVSILVFLDFIRDEVDFDFGADADGNRGTMLVSYECSTSRLTMAFAPF